MCKNISTIKKTIKYWCLNYRNDNFQLLSLSCFMWFINSEPSKNNLNIISFMFAI